MLIRGNKVYFDTDCLSAFLWVDESYVLFDLFKQDIVIPDMVYAELTRVRHFKEIIDRYISMGLMTKRDILSDSDEILVYNKIMFEDCHTKALGRGEAAVISMAVCDSKIMSSNNLSDVARYVREYELENYTVPDLLDMLVEQGIKTVEYIETMWQKMRERNFYLPNETYKEYVSNKKK